MKVKINRKVLKRYVVVIFAVLVAFIAGVIFNSQLGNMADFMLHTNSNNPATKIIDCSVNGQKFKATQEFCDTAPQFNIKSISIAPTAKKVNVISNSTQDADPIISCTRGTQCATVQVRRSECQQYQICCELGNTFVLKKSIEECRRDQSALDGNKNSGAISNQKVAYTTHQGIVDGTFYCYSNRVNELARLEQLISAKQGGADVNGDYCRANAKNESDNCSNNCPSEGGTDCISNCVSTAYNKCQPSSGDYELGDLRRQLQSKIAEICP